MKFHSSSFHPTPTCYPHPVLQGTNSTRPCVTKSLARSLKWWHFCLPALSVRSRAVTRLDMWCDYIKSWRWKKDISGWKAYVCNPASSLPRHSVCQSRCGPWWPSWQALHTWVPRQRRDVTGHLPQEAADPLWHPPGKHCMERGTDGGENRWRRIERILDGLIYVVLTCPLCLANWLKSWMHSQNKAGHVQYRPDSTIMRYIMATITFAVFWVSITPLGEWGDYLGTCA